VGSQQDTEPEAETTSSEQTSPDAGDETETEININSDTWTNLL